MSLFKKIFGFGKIEAPTLEKTKMQLAFVLLPSVEFPASDAIIAAFATYSQGHHKISIAADNQSDSADSDKKEVLVASIDGIGSAFIALMPCAIPNGEAEANFPYSMSSFSDKNQLQEHAAHLMVTLMISEETDAIEGMMAFTSLLAAITESTQSMAVYWGNAGVTHTRDFFLAVASEQEINPRIILWNGISRAPEGGGKMSFLSLGMNQIALPNVYLICDATAASEMIGRMFDLMAYIASRRQAIPAGDTFGSTAEDRIRVEYVKSPADPKQIVWKIKM